jgi:hypothetical protein
VRTAPSDHASAGSSSAAETATIHDRPSSAGKLPRSKDRNDVARPLGAATASAPWRRPAGPAAPGTRALVRHRRAAPPERGGPQVPVPPRRRRQAGLRVAGAESVRACAVSPHPAPREGPDLLHGGHRRLPRVHQEQVVAYRPVNDMMVGFSLQCFHRRALCIFPSLLLFFFSVWHSLTNQCDNCT